MERERIPRGAEKEKGSLTKARLPSTDLGNKDTPNVDSYPSEALRLVKQIQLALTLIEVE